ncbi:hypothetical protein [Alicyclobacillus ferrooxydans]|uniref:Uncharacterized protein n=1 Tax=Alicyclobacillus ferrooxydans TaxID=471514 RepID=A0A0P9CUE4_9BACL|nr:hypothetical protein [Alicyclobacillus ferrooxydans]KPV43306.1 hypothetical protein AN477_13100 [Alicyclobacillus ferrooxydans]
MAGYEICAGKFATMFEDLKTRASEELNEAETRLKIIDELLFECLGWSRDHVTVETHVHDGFIDYKLGSSGHRFLIEAKRVGRSFSLPNTFKYETHLTIKHFLKKQKDLAEVYEQAVRYAHESAVKFCVLTNGADWIVFPGVRVDDVPIRESRVILFAGLEAIAENFLEFWGLFSEETVSRGSLEQKLLPAIGRLQPSFIFNSEGRMNAPYDRNVLATAMTQLLPPYFGDLLIEDADTRLLEECYVVEASVRDILESLGDKDFHDALSTTIRTLARSKQFAELKDLSQRLHSLITNFLSNPNNEYNLQVMLGRVGIGKTTFLGHFFRVEHTELGASNFVLRLNFHDVTEDTNIEHFFEERLWNLVSSHELFVEYSTYDNLKRLFQQDIEAMERGPLAFFKNSQPEVYEAKISEFLLSKFGQKLEFAERLTNYVRKRLNVRVIFVFDNVDQLAQSLQEKVILFAYAQTRRFKAFSIISMWEETFYAMKTSGRALATINTQPLEMLRQGILPIIGKRLEFIARLLESGAVPELDLDEAICSRDKLNQYLRLMVRSLAVENKSVRTFLEFIALGNIRKALEMFVQFMCAGSLDSGKILSAMDNKSYLVPVHEFVKCIMLGSKKYFSEHNSHVLNLFSVGDMEAPSHFTRLRILQYLHDRRHESTAFGHGFVPISTLTKALKTIGTSEQDCTQSLAGLTLKGLVENELHALRSFDEANSVRISATGRYYLTDLKNLFAYLDLVWHDTPIFDRDTFNILERNADATDMRIRFERCSSFLQYLSDEEEAELVNIRNFTADAGLLRSHTSDMQTVFDAERTKISAKLGIDR